MTYDFQCMDCRNRDGRKCLVFGAIPVEYLTSVEENLCPKREQIEVEKGFDPSQPRDAAGKWSETGGETSVADAARTALPQLEESDFRALANARPGSKVTVTHGQSYLDGSPVIHVKADGGGVTSHRIIKVAPDGSRFMQNISFDVAEELRGQGVGTSLFRAQVEAARKAGLTAIVTEANRDEGNNGYYTWARLGFEGKAKLGGREVRISEQMATKAGRDAWKKSGKTFVGTFSLKEGSYSMRALAAYKKR